MTMYLNKSGESSVLGYSFTKNSISISFRNQMFVYTYNDIRPGLAKVQEMIQLAISGKGLNSYIKTKVKGNYFLKTPTR